MLQHLVSEIPPFSSLQVQRTDGGFLCVIPPSAPMGAKTSGDVAAAIHLFLGASETPSGESTAGETLSLDLSQPIKFDWLEYRCPVGSVFGVSKITRVDNASGRGRAYMMTYHASIPGSQHQIVAFDRASVMDRLKLWLAMGPSETSVAEDVSALLSLEGMRPNPAMPLDDVRVFSITVTHASRVEDFTGGTPYVARSTEPLLAVGLIDADVLSYVVDELGSDLMGIFAARIEECWLEFGPRVDGEDG